jgi:predicted GIY-YIG superfamily endonuclease
MNWCVYILKCRDDSLYTGITNNLENRMKAHADGRGARYTKGRGPFTVIYREDCPDRSTASKRESEIRKLSRGEKLILQNANR